MNISEYVLNLVKFEKPMHYYIQNMEGLKEHRHLIFNQETDSKIYTVVDDKNHYYYSDDSGKLFGKVDDLKDYYNVLNYYLDFEKFGGKSKDEVINLYLEKHKQQIVVDRIRIYLSHVEVGDKNNNSSNLMQYVYQNIPYFQENKHTKFIDTVKAKIKEFINTPNIMDEKFKNLRKVMLQYKDYFPDILTPAVIQKLSA